MCLQDEDEKSVNESRGDECFSTIKSLISFVYPHPIKNAPQTDKADDTTGKDCRYEEAAVEDYKQL